MSNRINEYAQFLMEGGVLENLPHPISDIDKGLYALCVNGVGLEKKAEGFYRCVLNSDSGGQNFFGGFYDLGSHRIQSVKLKTRFKITGSELPTKIDLRLFASNTSARSVVSTSEDYFSVQEVLKNQAVSGTIYTYEHTFPATSNPTGNAVKNLNAFRYLKPFVALHKSNGSDAQRTIKHSVEVYEMTLEIDGVIYDITDTVMDLNGGVGSKIEYVCTSLSSESVRLRKLPYFGKTIACLGDSITWGVDGAGDGSTRIVNPWVSQLSDLCGFKNIRNNGISSSTVATNSKVAEWTKDRNPMVDRVAGLDGEADVVIFKGGINDFWLNVPLGTFNPESTTTETYYDGLNKVFKDLKTKYPNAIIVAMTHLDYKGKDAYAGYGETGNGNKDTLDEFRQAVRDVAKHYGINVFELQQAVGFSALNDEDYKAYIPDGLHPNQPAADKMAIVIAEYLNSLA